jgi:type VI protein secretion system component Hcp
VVGRELFVQLSGIAGDAVEAAHVGWSDGQAVLLTVARPGLGAVDFELTVEKELDSATPKLLERLTTGLIVPTAKVELCERGTQACPLRITLTTAFLSSLAQRPGSERLELGFQRIEVLAGTGTPTPRFGWNVALSQPF